MVMDLQAKSLKATVVLDAEAVSRIQIPNGMPKTTLTIAVAGRVVTAEVNSKSLRRCVAAIGAAGPEGVAVVLQGKLEANDVLAEAGIAATPKAQKPAVAA